MNVDLLHVFTFEGAGGNPTSIVCDADGMAPVAMQSVARDHGHESGFVLSEVASEFDYTFRFWVPNHEMEMCGHATIGALWILATKNLTDASEVRINTLSGVVTGFISRAGDGSPAVEITQPVGMVRDLDRDTEENVLSVLRLSRDALLDLPIQNATTSRTKTLVPIRDFDRLNSLEPDYSAIEDLCIAIGSTGLYPYVQHDDAGQVFEARQFPRSSGYPEDPATGIAATALTFGLLRNGLIESSSRPIRIMQGRAMGRLSQINVRLRFAEARAIGCLVGGSVTSS